MKKVRLVATVLLLASLAATTAYAGQWKKENGKWTYVNNAGQTIKEGWFHDTDGKWYNFSGGVVRAGDVLIGNYHYFFDRNSGEMRTGMVNDNDNTYFYSLNGEREYSWVRSNNRWYYFDTNTGAALKNTYKTLNGEKYYFKSDGTMAVSEWVGDQSYAGATGAIASDTWVDGQYINSSGKVTNKESSSSTSKKKIGNKVFTLAEYMEYVTDAMSRYSDYMTEVANGVEDWRSDYNEKNVYNYQGDDDDYYAKNELMSWDIGSDSYMDKAATLRAVELASCQRASGNRPDGRDVDTIFDDLGISADTWSESVAFGYDDGEDCFEAFKSNSTHTGLWKNVNYTRAGVGVAADSTGKMYCVIMYAN